jgi:type VI secretion system protein ImpM
LITSTASPVAGWYGKIPALGDFASRRLPAGFVNSWDIWLQNSLAASRLALLERWPDIYLNSPIWRFLLLPGVCGNSCWTGILMPSVDKVGRHFPLTFAVALDPQPETITTVFAAQKWFAVIEEIALSSVRMDFRADELEKWLVATPFSTCLQPDYHLRTAACEFSTWWNESTHASVVLSLPDPDSINSVLSAGGLNLLSTSGFGKSLWWTCDEVSGVSQLQGFNELPPKEHFAILLAGMEYKQKSI